MIDVHRSGANGNELMTTGQPGKRQLIRLRRRPSPKRYVCDENLPPDVK